MTMRLRCCSFIVFLQRRNSTVAIPYSNAVQQNSQLCSLVSASGLAATLDGPKVLNWTQIIVDNQISRVSWMVAFQVNLLGGKIDRLVSPNRLCRRQSFLRACEGPRQ